MIDHLAAAFSERWTTTDEMLRTVALRVDLLWRQQVVNGGGEDPGPMEILRPGETPMEKAPAWKAAFRDMARGG